MKHFRFVKNSELIYATFSARVFLVGLILSITFFLLLIDSNKSYQSEISILVNTKSDVAAINQAQIVGNIFELPKTLAFYNRLLKLNPDVRDVFAGQSAEQRKGRWNQMLRVERSNIDASVIKISVTANREADASALASKTVRTLFDTTAFYYNVKNDVDLRIIDGPITRAQVSNWFWLFAVSVISGFAISWLLQHLVFSDDSNRLSRPSFLKMNSFFDFKKSPEMPGKDELESLNNLYQTPQVEEPFVFEQESEGSVDFAPTADEEFEEIKKITKKLEQGKYPNFPEMPVEPKKFADAPDNLPIADSSYFAESAASEESIPAQPTPFEEEKTIDGAKEPTPQQLKERLNQLLSGKF
jgi:capsular polysaccharide biosynthesis protein